MDVTLHFGTQAKAMYLIISTADPGGKYDFGLGGQFLGQNWENSKHDS